MSGESSPRPWHWPPGSSSATNVAVVSARDRGGGNPRRQVRSQATLPGSGTGSAWAAPARASTASSPASPPATLAIYRSPSPCRRHRTRRLSGRRRGGSEESELRVSLVGVSCVGTTPIGRILADRRGWSFFDLDDEIERHFGTSIERLQAGSLLVTPAGRNAPWCWTVSRPPAPTA